MKCLLMTEQQQLFSGIKNTKPTNALKSKNTFGGILLINKKKHLTFIKKHQQSVNIFVILF